MQQDNGVGEDSSAPPMRVTTESDPTERAVSPIISSESSGAAVSPGVSGISQPHHPQKEPRSRSISPSKKQSGAGTAQRRLGKEEMQAMAERLSRVETKERKEKKAHPMQLKYEYDATSRKYTEKYTRAKKVTGEAQTEYLKALAERCVTKQQQTEEALRQKYLKPLNADAKRVTKAGMEEHLAKLQRLYQGQGVVDKPVKG